MKELLKVKLQCVQFAITISSATTPASSSATSVPTAPIAMKLRRTLWCLGCSTKRSCDPAWHYKRRHSRHTTKLTG